MNFRSIVTAILLMVISLAFAALRTEFSNLDKLYESGKLNEISEAISTLKASNDDERACIGYYNALLKIKTSEAITAHDWLIEKFPRSDYAQASRLELGKMYILERRFEEASEVLRKITSTSLMQRFYWLAQCAWWKDDFNTAISNAETYLRIEPKGEFAEAAHYLIAECYLEQKKAYSAATTLTKLQKLNLPDVDEQYLLYRLGYAYEQSEKLVDAVSAYRRGYELNKYSQVAYLIEDRLFELRSRSRNIDISFLYPYSLLQIAVNKEDSTSQAITDVVPDVQSNTIIPTPPIVVSSDPVNQSAPAKVKNKPSSGYWLQAGRFSVEANANKLVVNIRLYNIPAVYYEDVAAGNKSWVVLCGAFTDKSSAENAKRQLADKEISSFIVQY